MKIMVTWQLHQGKLHDTLAKFSKMTPEQEMALGLNKLKLLGRWHDLARGRGAAVYETDNAAAFAKYAMAWNSVMDLDVAVVLDDAETRALGAG